MYRFDRIAFSLPYGALAQSRAAASVPFALVLGNHEKHEITRNRILMHLSMPRWRLAFVRSASLSADPTHHNVFVPFASFVVLKSVTIAPSPESLKMFQNEAPFCARSIGNSSENPAADRHGVAQNDRILTGHGDFTAIAQNANAVAATTCERGRATPHVKMQETPERQRNCGRPDCQVVVQNASLHVTRHSVSAAARYVCADRRSNVVNSS
jgi:hypothetical protein